MGLGSHIAEGLRPVVDLLYPPRCPLCGDAVADQGGLCVECWSDLEVPGEPACASCNRPLGSGNVETQSHCYACKIDPPSHSGIYAATLYSDASRKLILSFKHGRKIALAPLLARLIAARLTTDIASAPLLIPVPLHRWRLWHRGFNQAALLAQELAKLGKGDVLVDALIRRKRTPSLGGLGQKERENALRGAITFNRSRTNRLAGRDVILVDDVLTSGATSNACVDVLLNRGARSVSIACFARVVDGVSERSKAKLVSKNVPETITPEVVKTPGAT
ncbi:ComF family protein [Erythrobacter insulae]|uniref:ComF family protein n=1 Tax=Erythrobacter insulae TaxID=2584124 RepID=A0A547P6X9_9SPHN|nr:ComF family protein [Erythrobacter insulae]TRD09891.1 ComF family protein [Erythrobacter insulae]